MNAQPEPIHLPAEVDAQLDELLAIWVTQTQLDPEVAQLFQQEIINPPAETTFAWWQVYMEQISANVMRSIERQQTFSQNLNATLNRLTQPSAWSMGQPSDWQPYLKLT